MSAPLVVEVIRSGAVESEHLIDAAVCDPDGTLVAWAGDPERAVAFRSSAKPIQASVSVACGWEPPGDEALAIACASHNGEPGHVDAVRGILEASGVPEDALACPSAWPFRPGDVALATQPSRVRHNCSGKHAAMLAACAAAAWPLEGYRAPGHPLQQRMLARVRETTGCEPRVLVDGCGVPTFLAPLRAFARAFATVAGTPEARAMRAHPWLVGGTERFDTALMEANDGVVTKAGAEGLACVLAAGVSIVLKARDGAARARGPAVLHVLAELGSIDDAALERLAEHREPSVLGGGEPVGVARARGVLARA